MYRGPKTLHLKWTNTLNFKELEKYWNLSGPKHSLPVGSGENDFFEIFVTNDFCNKFGEETHKYAASSQRKSGTVDNNWEDTNAEDIRAYIGILIYMGLLDLLEIEDYFQGDFCVCPIVSQPMTLQRLKKNWDKIYTWMMKKDLTSKVQILTSCIKQNQF